MTTTQEEFFNKYLHMALNVELETGIPAALILSHAALESNWGKSGLTEEANNFFGIKGTGTAGSSPKMTKEYVGGKYITVKDNFRKYISPEDSFRDYANLLSNNPQYAPIIEAAKTGDLDAVITAMDRSPYATDPQQGAKLRSIVQKNDLVNRLDKARQTYKTQIAKQPITTPQPTPPIIPQADQQRINTTMQQKMWQQIKNALPFMGNKSQASGATGQNPVYQTFSNISKTIAPPAYAKEQPRFSTMQPNQKQPAQASQMPKNGFIGMSRMPTPQNITASSMLQNKSVPQLVNGRIPSPRLYTVKPGDTLSGIAQSQLGSANKWKQFGYQGDPRKLQVGTKLRVG